MGAADLGRFTGSSGSSSSEMGPVSKAEGQAAQPISCIQRFVTGRMQARPFSTHTAWQIKPTKLKQKQESICLHVTGNATARATNLPPVSSGGSLSLESPSPSGGPAAAGGAAAFAAAVDGAAAEAGLEAGFAAAAGLAAAAAAGCSARFAAAAAAPAFAAAAGLPASSPAQQVQLSGRHSGTSSSRRQLAGCYEQARAAQNEDRLTRPAAAQRWQCSRSRSSARHNAAPRHRGLSRQHPPLLSLVSSGGGSSSSSSSGCTAAMSAAGDMESAAGAACRTGDAAAAAAGAAALDAAAAAVGAAVLDAAAAGAGAAERGRAGTLLSSPSEATASSSSGGASLSSLS